MPAKKDVAAELAEQLVAALEQQRFREPNAYPLSLGSLAELAAPQATPAQVLKAAAKRSFQARAAVVRAKTLETPVALAGDAELLAGSSLALEFMLAALRTPTNHALSVARLKTKVTSKLKTLFQRAIEHGLEHGSLPPTVGWLTIDRSRRLFLLTDLHTGRQGPGPLPAPPARDTVVSQPPLAPPAAPPPREPPADPGDAFDRAFRQLDRESGAHNFVSLVDLRRALAVPREAFDAELRRLRLAGRYSLSAAEGRHGTSPVEREAGIMEDGTLLLYVSSKSP
jgi:hypothetical protein